MREAGGGVFRVADGDLLEILDAPEIAVLTHGAEIEARHAERLRADFGIPAIEAAEVDVGRTVGEPTRFDGIQVVNEEEEHIAVGRIERRRILGDVDARVVNAGRPVQHAGDFPARVTGAVAGDALHGLDQLVVVDAAIVWAGDGAQLDPAVFGFERLYLLGPVRGQPVLQVNARECGWELTEIGGRCA
ncbi:hypothetical protein chiPu_0031622, partial [Chiloscyllium punctatum]|nr:hypothetical protein [Chiloscyllium punctatum]